MGISASDKRIIIDELEITRASAGPLILGEESFALIFALIKLTDAINRSADMKRK